MSDEEKLLKSVEHEVDAGVEEEYSDAEPSSSRQRSKRTRQRFGFQDMFFYAPRYPKLTRSSSTIKYLVLAVCVTLLALLGSLLYTFDQIPAQMRQILSLAQAKDDSAWVKPAGIRIVAIVFYGRPKFVNILDCYLKKNLVSRGGFLDEVVFADNTNWQEDEDYLDELIGGEELYKKSVMSHRGGWFHDVWNNLATDDNTLYIKIDDDVVFIDDDAIPRMVKTLMAHPEAHAIGANLINSPLTNWLHYHTNAVLPYLPDPTVPKEPREKRNLTSWRASDLPRYAGPHTGKWELPDFSKRPGSGWPIGSKEGPPADGHRWLPLADNAVNLHTTPIASGARYDAFGTALSQWHIPAQQHYSFLQRLEQKALDKYHFGNKDGIWNMQFDRYNLNFVATWGRNVNMMSVTSDDEQAMTVDIPRALKKPFLVDTHAIIAHYSFGHTMVELDQTDLLDRYRLYANEMVCAPDNQKKELAQKFNPKGNKTPMKDESRS